MNEPLRKPRVLAFCYIGTSLFGLCLLIPLTFKVQAGAAVFTSQKQLIGSVFMAICLMGMKAGTSPSKCSRIVHFGSRNSSRKEQVESEMTETTFKGHHPPCGKFAGHVLRLRDRTYCAGCAGLVAGAMVSTLGSVLYFLVGFPMGNIGEFVFWMGFLAVLCGLLQYHVFRSCGGSVHFFLNVVFVLGAFFLLVGTTESNGNFFLGLYLLALTVYWIMTRILLSRLEHEKICAACSSKPCVYF